MGKMAVILFSTDCEEGGGERREGKEMEGGRKVERGKKEGRGREGGKVKERKKGERSSESNCNGQ